MSDIKEQMLKGEPRILTWLGPQPLPQIPDKSLSVFMLEEIKPVAESRGDATAIVDAETGQKRTYSELYNLVPRVSAGLAVAGVGLGDRVMYYSSNHVDYPLWFLSVVHRGATIVLISPVYDKMKDDILHGIRLSGAKFAVIHAQLLDQAQAVFSLLPPDTFKKVWVIGGSSETSVIDDLAAHDPLPPITKADGLDVATTVSQMTFSSGTTGSRKGVNMSHRGEVCRLMMVKYLVQHRLWLDHVEANSTCLLVTPLSHTYAHSFLFSTLMLGGTSVFLHNFETSNVLEIIKREQVTLAILTPYQIRQLTDSSDFQPGDLPSLKAASTSGSWLSHSLAEAFKRKTNALLYTMWGMSELVGIGTLGLVTSDFEPFCIGKLVPFFELKVVDVNSGQMLGAGQPGELWFRSPISLLEYEKDPKASAAFKDEESWMHSGDYGYYDQKGLIYLTDRIKDLLKSPEGLQVQPSKLQGILMQHPDVWEAVVVGVQDESFEEVPRAFVVLKPGASVEPRILKQFVDDRVEDFKQLRGGLWVVKEIPKNKMGKPLLRMVRDNKVVKIASC